jgi:hypothetical protein
MQCPGSRHMARGRPNYTSEYAAEGTAAHELAFWCISRAHKPEQYCGKSLTAVKCEASGRVYQFRVDQEMIDGVNVYLDAIEAIKLEQRDKRVMYVVDFKYGAGIPVNVKNNKQLKYYALGAMDSGKVGAEVEFDLTSIRPEMFGTADYIYKNWPGPERMPEWVVFGIVQPRCEHPDGPVRYDEIHPLDLIEFADDLRAAVDATNDPNAPLRPGKPQCDWCLAAPVCPALRAKGYEAAKLVFGQPNFVPRELLERPVPVQPMYVPGHYADHPTFSDLRPVERTPAMVAHDLDLAEKAAMWIEAVHEDAYAQANAGVKFPGFKLVEKYGRRAYKNPEEAAKWALSAQVGGTFNAFTAPELKSPAQVEAAVKEATKGKELKKVRAVLLEQLGERVESKSSGLTLVREADKRPEVKRLTVADVFPKLPHKES